MSAFFEKSYIFSGKCIFMAKMVTNNAHLMWGEAREDEDLPIKSQQSACQLQAHLSLLFLSLAFLALIISLYFLIQESRKTIPSFLCRKTAQIKLWCYLLNTTVLKIFSQLILSVELGQERKCQWNVVTESEPLGNELPWEAQNWGKLYVKLRRLQKAQGVNILIEISQLPGQSSWKSWRTTSVPRKLASRCCWVLWQTVSLLRKIPLSLLHKWGNWHSKIK